MDILQYKKTRGSPVRYCSFEAESLFPVSSKQNPLTVKKYSPLSYCNRPFWKVCPRGAKTICRFELNSGNSVIEADTSWKLYLVRNITVEKMYIYVYFSL